MREFDYQRAADISEATVAASAPGHRLLAGGTTLIDLMKCDVEQPDALIDITRLTGLAEIAVSDSLIRIGSLSKMSGGAARRAAKGGAGADAKPHQRRLRAAAQYGDHRRQHHAAHALQLFPRRARLSRLQ